MTPSRDRLMDLLAEKATQGLSAEQTRELEALLAQHPVVHPDSLDLAAAAIAAGLAGDAGPVPASLRARLGAAADRFQNGDGVASRVAPKAPRRTVMWAGWIAAAACLTIVAIGWWLTHPSLATARARMLAKSGVVKGTWNPFVFNGSAPALSGVTGDVVWDEATQSGYMRFTGLPNNDPAREQYQVWLVDSRGLNFRISGGVFDATSGEVIVPITPAIRTQNVGAVAVTIEAPGGVIVSDMSRRVVIAEPKKS